MPTAAEFLTKLNTLILNQKCVLRQTGVSEESVDGQSRQVTRWFIRIPGHEGIKIIVDKGETENTLAVWKEGQRLYSSSAAAIATIIASIESTIEGYNSARTTAEIDALYVTMETLS
jgi:hypothetical protein